MLVQVESTVSGQMGRAERRSRSHPAECRWWSGSGGANSLACRYWYPSVQSSKHPEGVLPGVEKVILSHASSWTFLPPFSV